MLQRGMKGVHAGPTHENHEARFMILPFRPAPALPIMGLDDEPRSIVMKWETPAAIDFRFGMEITMYIANR
jgi:coenzyme PQQ precursor peptide PqqA